MGSLPGGTLLLDLLSPIIVVNGVRGIYRSRIGIVLDMGALVGFGQFDSELHGVQLHSGLARLHALREAIYRLFGAAKQLKSFTTTSITQPSYTTQLQFNK